MTGAEKKAEARARTERKLDERAASQRKTPSGGPPPPDFDEEEVTDVIDLSLERLEKVQREGAEAKRAAAEACAKIAGGSGR